MPIYVYECTNCGNRFEQHQHISDDPIQICPECGGQVQRLIQSVGVIFKGSGFYVTDNRRISGGSGRKGKSTADTSNNGKAGSAKDSTSKGEHEKSHSKAQE